ncbi:MAG: metalloregulator ArsR/SmtB family transcription factor [Anaerolineales bacterium]|jgi:ArsR family transcriptional regulator|nr:metalloregulator ArsR/SmtB family transcription factor [Anaerolineales bacterium]
MNENITTSQVSEKIANVLQTISAPARIAILLTIGSGEACVCHLEAALGWRQAYISQHLMALRKADILQDRREGRYVYYRLKDLNFLTLLRDCAALADVAPHSVDSLLNPQPDSRCECPICDPQPIASLLVARS